MILGLGLDFVEIARIQRVWERFGRRFARHLLHSSELAELERLLSAPGEKGRAVNPVNFLAGRFAVKEAVVKALGTGYTQGITPICAETVRLPSGGLTVRLHGPAQKRLEELGATAIHVSITHSRDNAAAVIVLEG